MAARSGGVTPAPEAPGRANGAAERAHALKVLVLLTMGGLYWHVVCRVADVNEPWDADAYWRLWYPASFALSAIGGWLFRRHRWLAGVILTFAQLPVMWLNTGTGSFWAVGLMIVCLLAIPAAAISMLAGRLADRVRAT